jgi:uncharacterized protein YyaL (SSP411 family)
MKREQNLDFVARLSRVDTKSLPPDGGEHFNRLIFEKSPYLLQHAENPVDWYPWNEAVFARARAEDKPVFLSIGYSTCHWCHVMAHESFENKEVAEVLNRHFVAVKVDREERPDIDGTYMAACQMMTGTGGWPTTLVLTPDKKPFFAATYLPPASRGGMAGLLDILAKIAELWLTDRSKLMHTGEELRQALVKLESSGGEESAPSELPLKKACDQFLETFDRRHGGFGRAPKFPMPHNISLLLRLWKRYGEEKLRVMALQTLQAVRLGGIFDQIGFGLHRYSVDERWLVPHFEKMLYDQALAVHASLDAFQATGDHFFGQAAREILEYAVRDLTGPEGGFCCGEDADSEGAEGTFYLWTPVQAKEILGDEPGTVFCRCFDITEQGNFEGRNIPHLEEDVDTLAKRVGVDPGRLSSLLAEGRKRLFAARSRRTRPHRDDKILSGWNGLIIGALARAGAVLGDTAIQGAAEAAADFILEKLRDEKGRLLRRFCNGEAAVPGFLEDYAFLGWGLIELYMAGFETRYLAEAVNLVEEMGELFSDGRGGYFDTGADAEKVLTRGRSLQDGAVPSGTSVAAWNLLRLGRITGREDLAEIGERLIRTRMDQIGQYPSAYAQFLIALDFALGPSSAIVLAPAGNGVEPKNLLEVLRPRFLPRTVFLKYRPGDGELERLAPQVGGKGPVNGRAAAYVCRNRTCLAPVTDPADLEKELSRP